jgi:hypothetical protein
MRTLLNEVKLIEEHLFGNAETGDSLVVEATRLIDSSFDQKVKQQAIAYDVVNCYGRERLRHEIDAVHRQLFTQHKHRGFALKVLKWFTIK